MLQNSGLQRELQALKVDRLKRFPSKTKNDVPVTIEQLLSDVCYSRVSPGQMFQQVSVLLLLELRTTSVSLSQSWLIFCNSP